MAIFDNELLGNVSNREPSIETSTIESPTIGQVDTTMGGFGTYGKESIAKTGLTIDELSKLKVDSLSTVDSPFQSVLKSELIANKKYPLFERGKDLENIYGLQQSWTSRLANGIVKFGATGVGTFLQGFSTIPNTIDALKSGEISDLSNEDGYEASIDTWLKNLEDNFPNYYTRYERENPFRTMIPFTTGSANFWGDKVIKNLGFTAGAIANAIVTDLAIGAITGGIGEIPLIAAQVGKVSLFLNKIFAGTNNVDKVLDLAKALGKSEQQLLNIKRLAEVSNSIKLTSGPRYALSLYGSARTEGAVESRDSYNKIREELISHYKIENLGAEPMAEDLARINEYAEDAMNTRFGINMALLTVSNAVQFGNLFKSFNKTSKAITSLDDIALKEGSRDVFQRVVPTSVTGRVWDSVKPSVKNIFAEGVYEEGGQYATERGIYDYYTRKYKSPGNKATWDSVDETVSSTLKALKDQFSTTEGIENMVIGGITAMIAGGISNKIQSAKGRDKDSAIQASVNILNQYGLSGTLSSQYADTVNGVSIAKEMEEAVRSGDVYKYKNLQSDMFFNFVTSRIPAGMHEVTIEQLNMLRDLPKEEFEKTFGMDFNESTKTTVGEYVDSLIDEANYIKKVADSVDSTFKNPFRQVVNPKTPEEATETQKYHTFNEWKRNLVYYGSASRSINAKIADIEQAVANINTSVDAGLLAELSNKENLKELSRQYEEKANQLNKTITEYTTGKDKRTIRDSVKALRTASERINAALSGTFDTSLFNFLLNFEINGQDATKDKVVGNESSVDLFNYGVDINRLNKLKAKASDIFDALSTEEGFNKFFNQAENIETPTEAPPATVTTPEIVTRSGVKEPIQIGSEYLSYDDKKATVKKLADDRWEVVTPAGISTFHATEAAAKDAEDEINENITNIKKVKVLAVNPDNTIKIQDVNGDIYDISPDRLVGYERILTEQEKLKNFKEDLDNEQKDIQTGSGSTSTNDLSADIGFSEFEVKKKATSILFTSTTSASEDFEAGNLTPHHLRSIEFLNNVKNLTNKEGIRAILVTQNQEVSLGLEGLTALSLAGTGLETNKYTDLNQGLVAAVYVEQSGRDVYFVDKEGKRLTKVGETVDLNQAVFSTMPNTYLTWNDGKTPRYRDGQREEAAEQSKRWEAKRKQLFAMPAGQYEIYTFAVSRGIANITDVYDRNEVGGVLVPKDKISTQEGLIVVPTTGTIFHQGELLNFPNGRPVLQYGDTLQFLSNNTFTKGQVASIYHVMKLLSQNVKDQLAAGGKIKLNRKYTKFLQNVLFYKDDKTLNKNQFFIDTNTMEMRFGDKRWDITKIADFEKEITDKLTDTYNSVNNYTLTKLFNEPFLELYLDGSTLKERKWVNYQTYLLSDKYPDDSARSVDEIPLSTSVNPVTEAVPYNFKQKYAILQGMELPQLSTPKPAAKATQAPRIGEYVVDGTTQNIYNLNSGPVPFTASIDASGEVSVSVEANDTINKIAATPASLKTVTNALKASNLFDGTKSDIENIVAFVANRIAADLKKQQTPAKPSEPSKGKDFGNTATPPNTEYRRVAGETPRMSPAEIDLFKIWHAENVPNIPYEILENILTTYDGEKAWGVFENGVAKFYKAGARGTEYHEIFEGIYKAFLSAEEQQLLLDEFKTKPGLFTDRESGKKIRFDQATDRQAKERIADDFADFRLGKLPAKSLGEKILRFFRSIIEFFKQFVNKPSRKQELFNAIEAGKFKEFVIPEAVKNDLAEYKKIEGLTEQQTNDLVQDITARLFQIVFGRNISLFSPDKMTAPEIFGRIKDVYAQEGKLELIGENAWNELLKRTREFLRTFKIEFDENNVLSINNEEQDKNLYAPEPFSTDWKKSSPFPVKLLVGSLTETIAQNQENNSSLELPRQKSSTVNGYKLFNFSRAFSTLLDKLGNISDIKEAVSKLLGLAKSDSNYVRLFTRLKGDLNTAEIDFSKFEAHDWRLFVNFYQTFTKQRPDAFIQYISEGEVYTGAANLFTNVKQVQRGWIENIKTKSKDKESIVRYNKPTKTYQVKDISGVQVKTPVQMVDFLSNLGVEFPMDAFVRLKAENGETRQFAEAVSAIRTYLGSEKDIMSVMGKTLGINSQLTTLAELLVKVTNPSQDLSYFGIDQKRRQLFADNNAASLLENEFNSSETLADLLEKRPELNDVFSTNSQILKPGGLFFNESGKRIKKLKVGYIQGTENLETGRSSTTSALSVGDRFTQEINQNVNGNYYILVPADSSTEWMLNLGNQISYEDVESGSAWTSVYTIFRNYLRDEVALAKQNNSHIRNVAARAQELRFFKDILPTALLAKVNNLILNDVTEEDVSQFINENTVDINAAVREFIQNDVNDTISTLTDTRQIVQTSETNFMYVDLDDTFAKREKIKKYGMSSDDVRKLITFTQMNYIINNIEFHKVLFGDPYQFAIKNNKLDETKRIKSFLSPRRTTFDSPEFNTFLNQQLNTVGGVELLPTDPGYHLHKSYVSTVTFDDVNITSELATINPAYKSVNEADSGSWIMDSTYREVKLKNGQWSEEAEQWHQWQMAFTRQNMPGYKYSNDRLKQHDIKLLSKPAAKYVLDVLKPIVSGNKHLRDRIDTLLDKFSQMPIYYSAVKGTNLEKLYIKMFKEQIGYGVVISGRKVGAEDLHSLYKEDGSFNSDAFNNRIDVPWRAYGIQVENAYDRPKEQTRGSQLTKLSSLDLFDNGVASSPEAQKEFLRNRNILDLMHRNGYKILLEKLGIEDLDGSFRLIDNVSVSQSLEQEMLRREVSENMKDTVQLDENGEFRIPFEASSAYIQIKDILYSMVDKAILSPKMNGSSHVQVPVTLWESSGQGRKVVEINGKKVFTSSALKFYTKEEPWMEVMLPAWFKDKLSRGKFKTDSQILSYLNRSEEGKNILKGIGFRIPTQSMSSIENLRVVGFLPSYMGSTVVVPSEIVTKAGSDFDIDKLNVYLKAVYVDEKGNIKLVKYKGSEEGTKMFYADVFNRRLERKKITTSDILEALQLIHQGPEYVELYDTKNLVERYAEVLNAIISETDDLAEKEEQLLQKIEQYGDEGLQEGLKKEFVDDMYKRSLENEYYDSLEKLITLPENFERLISPVDDAGLKKLSDRMDVLMNEDEDRIKNRLLNRVYMSSLRHAFVLGKKWVGIAAVNITGHSLTQKSEVFIDPTRLDLVSAYDMKWLGDGTVALPHNTTPAGNISISGVKTANGKQYISDRLSGYATSFVDVSKDPYILKLIRSNLAIGTFMFLERIGVGENTALFMNQPIIRLYLEYLDSINARGLFNTKNIDYIKSKFISTKAQIEDAEIAVNALSDNIKTFAEKGKFDTLADNAIQHKILDEFLKYAKMAEYSFKLTQASNYDTSTFRSADSLFKKQIRTEEAIRSNIFSSVTKILDNSHIGEQSLLLAYSSEAIGEVLKLDKYEFRAKTNPVLKPYAQNEFLSNDKYDRVANRVITSFIDYIVQTKSALNTEIKALLVDAGTSVADQLAIAKKDRPDIRLLKELSIESSGRVDGAKSIKLKANLKTAYDENLYTEMFRELKAALPGLYNDIVKLSILQGTYQTAISIANVVPLEDRAAIMSPILQTLNADNSLNSFAEGAFQRNNWRDEDVFRRVMPKFFTQDTLVGQDPYGNDIYQYFSPSFPSVENLGIKSVDRKILVLSEKYNLFDVAHDFIIVPRVVRDSKTGSRIDMTNGRTVTNAMFKARSVKGDLSLRDVFGYQKVKYADGTPLLTFDKDGNASHIYKLINLWGDGQYASEYYTDFKPSVLDNGSVKIETEMSDADIIAHYSRKTETKPVPLPAQPIQETTDEESPREFIMRMKGLGMFNPSGDVYSHHLDLGMPTKDINKALTDIERYNFGTVPAKRLLAKMEAMRKTGMFNLIAGSGGMVSKIQEPIPPRNTESNETIPPCA